MGFLGKLSLFFGTSEIVEKKEILALKDLEDWVHRMRGEVIRKEKLGELATRYVQQIRDQRWFLECKLDEWQELVRTEDRARVMALFGLVRGVLDTIVFARDSLLVEIYRKSVALNESLKELLVKIEGNSVLFMPTDERSVTFSFKHNPLLDELRKLNVVNGHFLESMNQKNFGSLETLEERSKQIVHLSGLIFELEKRLEERLHRLDFALAKKVEKEQSLEQLKAEPGFADIAQFLFEQQALLKKRQVFHSNLISTFGEITPLLERYSLRDDSMVLRQYIDDCAQAFACDEERLILNIIAQIQDLLERGELVGEGSVTYRSLGETYEKIIALFSEAVELEDMNVEVPGEFRLLVIRYEEILFRLLHFQEQKSALHAEVEVLERERGRISQLRSEQAQEFENLACVVSSIAVEISFPTKIR